MARGLSPRVGLAPILCSQRGGGSVPARISWQRRAPLLGAFCVLSLGALSALASRTAWAWSQPLFPSTSFWSTATKRTSVQRVRFIRMESSSTTVPSIVVYVSVPSKDAGKPLRRRLTHCSRGVESVYWWDGKVQTDAEELLIIKTRESLLESLTEHVKANHEYEVPEVIALPIIGGSDKYLAWIKNSTRDG